MPFRFIPGKFRPDIGIPDGDSVRFKADDPALLDSIESRPAMFLSEMTVQLRYEGIDTLEKNAIQPFASQATAQNLALLMGAGGSSRPRGYILSRMFDNTGSRRPISFVFSGELDATPGDSIFLTVDLVKRSVNYKLIEGGFAYPFFFKTLFAELREAFVEATRSAQAAGRGVWAADGTLTGVDFAGRDDIDELAPIFPRLFRRLEDFGTRPDGLAGFPDFVDRMNTRLMTISDARLIEFADVIAVEGNNVKMVRDPTDLVFFD